MGIRNHSSLVSRFSLHMNFTWARLGSEAKVVKLVDASSKHLNKLSRALMSNLFILYTCICYLGVYVHQ